MAFPVNPVSGDLYTNPLGTTYMYEDPPGTWRIVGQTLVGATGVAGPTGTQGPAGQGYAGMTGVQGPTGPGGGDPGVTGVQGETGVQGFQGVTGLANFIDSTALPQLFEVQSLMWSQTNEALYAGITGIGHWVQISAGSTQGATGWQGMTGPRGFTGVQGATGVQGVQGQTGSKGNTGVQGATGAFTPSYAYISGDLQWQNINVAKKILLSDTSRAYFSPYTDFTNNNILILPGGDGTYHVNWQLSTVAGDSQKMYTYLIVNDSTLTDSFFGQSTGIMAGAPYIGLTGTMVLPFVSGDEIGVIGWYSQNVPLYWASANLSINRIGV